MRNHKQLEKLIGIGKHELLLAKTVASSGEFVQIACHKENEDKDYVQTRVRLYKILKTSKLLPPETC